MSVISMMSLFTTNETIKLKQYNDIHSIYFNNNF